MARLGNINYTNPPQNDYGLLNTYKLTENYNILYSIYI